MKIDDAASRLEALGNPTRLRIYRALVRAGEPGLPVGKLQSRLAIPASTLSHHLKSLIVVGLITQERDGTTLICRTNYPVMRGTRGLPGRGMLQRGRLCRAFQQDRQRRMSVLP